ncbi:MAG: hypothetical protein ACOX0Z_02645 [Candidatus Nanosyncoccaceae bacterium]|jgi:hypothetical protein
MLILPNFVLLISAAIRLLGGVAYIRATIRGKAKPNSLTWLLWGITPTITLFAVLSVRDTSNLIVTAALALSPLAVSFVAIRKDRRSLRFDKFNSVCAILAIIGIILWYFTKNPNLAILLAIAADFVSSLPTIVKAKHQPASEYPPTYIMSATAMLLALLTIPKWTFTNSAFMVYVFVLNIIIANLSTFGRLRKLKAKN